jgi:predicted choloylglycine hydrolase
MIMATWKSGMFLVAVAARIMGLTVLTALVAGCNQSPQATATAPDPQPESAPFPVPVVELEGSGDEIGAEHAARLGDVVRALHDEYLGAWFQDSSKRFLALAAANGFETHVLPEHRDEVNGIASGTQIDPREIMLAQCFLDLAPMTGCSTLALPAEASPDGVARFGRNLDFPSFNVADKQSVVFIVRPQGRFAFAAVGWPGIVGVLSGMNEHGLCLANMEVRRGIRLPVAMPYMLLYRTILEQCRTVDEAISLLESSKRQTANNLMLMDAAGNRAVAEIRPESVVVRRGQAGEALISTNHQRGQNTTTLGRCDRYDRLKAASTEKFGRIDEPSLQSLMAQVAQGDMTMQSMVFEPANRVIYLSVGLNAPNASEFHRLDLAPYFARHVANASN